MSDPRKPIFDAIRTAGGSVPDRAAVERVHAVLDTLGVPRFGAVVVPAGPIACIDLSLLRVVCRSVSDIWVSPIRAACIRFEINSIRRIAAFIAQMAHESRCFKLLDEDMFYTTAGRIVQVWPSRFNLQSATAYLRNPEKLGNFVYANRMGNGPPESGDGYKMRGGGPLHVTGRDNWQAFADEMGMSLDEALAFGRTPEGGIMSAAWFWEANDINRLADTPGVADESKRINGGTNGLAERKAFFDALVSELLKREAA